MGCCPFPNAVICSSYQCCPSETYCQAMDEPIKVSSIYNCIRLGVEHQISKRVCKPGASPASQKITGNSLKNVFIIGDSLAIGYTPFVAEALHDIASVYHAPWDSNGGGAEVIILIIIVCGCVFTCAHIFLKNIDSICE